MTSPSTGGFLASLSQPDRVGLLTQRVKNLPVSEFVCLLDFITAEFQQSLQAFDLVNNVALEQILEQIIDALTFKIGQVLQAEYTTIFLVEADKEQLWAKLPADVPTPAPSADAPPDSSPLKELRVPLNLGITGQAAATGQVQNVTDAAKHPKFEAAIDALGHLNGTGVQARHLLCVPVRSSGGAIVAVVQLLNKVGTPPSETPNGSNAFGASGSPDAPDASNVSDAFNGEDEERFQEFANSIGIILESCQSFHTVARNQRGVTALLKAMTCLSQTLNLEGTLRVVMKEACDLIQAEHSNFFLYDADRDRLIEGNPQGRYASSPRMLPRDRGIVGYVARTGQTLNISNVGLDDRFDPAVDQCPTGPIRNVLCMAVSNPEGKLIGVSQLINRKQGSFSASDEAFLKAFNIQAGVALENARLFETVLLEQQYQRDILRSLSNAVISTDMEGKIVTINVAALELLGCPVSQERDRVNAHEGVWKQKLVGRPIWDILPLNKLSDRLNDSLGYGARSYVPEQPLSLLLAQDEDGYPALAQFQGESLCLWNTSSDPVTDPQVQEQLQTLEMTVNVAITPLTNREGDVRGALVVLEDISREKRLKATMYRYMHPKVADQAIALGDESLMAGERKDVTILFSDIRGYTTLTENLGAAEVVSLLNTYFGTMVEAVFEYGGTLDKFIGDALMAIFGAPLPLTDDHAWMAVACALEMRSRLKQFNRRRQLLNQTPIEIGIGVSSGEVVVGNIGSNRRMDYTAIGDAVNVSARLEALTKQYGCDMIISESTYAHCRDRVWARDLDQVRVKGKTEVIRIYEILGLKTKRLSRTQQEFLERYHLGRRAYENYEFQRAMVHFAAAQQLRPKDQGVKLHLERITAALDCPPADLWATPKAASKSDQTLSRSGRSATSRL